MRQVAQRRVGIERLIEDSDAAAVGEAARAEAVDGKGHVSPGTQPIRDPGEMPGNANTAVQYDNRRERSAAVGRTAELRCQTGIRSRQIAVEILWRLSREVRKFDESAGRGSAGIEQRGQPDREQGYPESDPSIVTRELTGRGSDPVN